MTPEEKAKELIDKFTPDTMDWTETRGYAVNTKGAKSCALIAVDEIINTNKWFFAENYSKTIDMEITEKYSKLVNFWYEVKEEINKL